MGQFLKKHRKEILTTIGAVAVTSAVFMLKGRRIDIPNAWFSVHLNINNGEKPFPKDNGYLNLHFKDSYTVADLGKVGEEIIKTVPRITADTKINNVTSNFNF